MKQFSLFILLLTLNISTVAQAFPKHNPVPGGICILNLAAANSAKPRVTYQGKPIAVVQQQQQWKALIGIPLSASVGSHEILIRTANFPHPTTKNCQIKSKKYRSQHIKLKNKSQVNPKGKKLERILREMKLKKNLKQTFSANQPSLDFIRPVKGRDNGRFGLKRFFNGQARNPHSGMDIAAPTGRAIKASATGKVIYTGNLFFSGNVVVVDHGQGLLSLYAHMSQIIARQGQTIQQGTIIGKVGKTGRATGPHLHWSVYLNGNAVNPALFL
jgi:murein DD-endopeptidase MepM/ murein hydrolase activator NlpD